MELKTNSKCQLIIEGKAPVSGLEVVVFGDNYEIIRREDTEDYFIFDMPEDGLFQYYILNFTEEPKDILEYIQDNSILPECEVFSICKLRNCLLQKEKDYISQFLSECNTNSHCSKNSEDELIRNFLLSSIFILEHLICSGQTVEALRILRNINSSCTLCSNIESLNKCGCNGRN